MAIPPWFLQVTVRHVVKQETVLFYEVYQVYQVFQVAKAAGRGGTGGMGVGERGGDRRETVCFLSTKALAEAAGYKLPGVSMYLVVNCFPGVCVKLPSVLHRGFRVRIEPSQQPNWKQTTPRQRQLLPRCAQASTCPHSDPLKWRRCQGLKSDTTFDKVLA